MGPRHGEIKAPGMRHYETHTSLVWQLWLRFVQHFKPGRHTSSHTHTQCSSANMPVLIDLSDRDEPGATQATCRRHHWLARAARRHTSTWCTHSPLPSWHGSPQATFGLAFGFSTVHLLCPYNRLARGALAQSHVRWTAFSVWEKPMWKALHSALFSGHSSTHWCHCTANWTRLILEARNILLFKSIAQIIKNW